MMQVCLVCTFFMSFYESEKKEDKIVLANVFFMFFYESEKEIKVYSTRENVWLNSMFQEHGTDLSKMNANGTRK
jgi:hypothetical protein